MKAATVQVLEGNTFTVSDDRGDIEASATEPTGLFSFDTRFLSRWILTIDGARLHPLSTDALRYYEVAFFLVPGTGTVYVDAPLSVVRRRTVADGFLDELLVLNHTDVPAPLVVRLEAAADFADLFEIKDALAKSGAYSSRIEDGRLVLAYRRDTFVRETWISSTTPAAIDPDGLSFTVTVPAHGEWRTQLEVRAVVPAALDAPSTPRLTARGVEKWVERAPRLECDAGDVERTYERSLTDLAALRFTARTLPGRALPAAGLPWFMTVFGRDSILTSLQALPFVPELAETTLLALAERQGTRIDDFRDEDPGRILHEVRYGEMAAFEERPHSPYYGSADATPLFVVLLDEYERWTGDRRLVRELEPAARAALDWSDRYADLQGNGYVSYQRRNEETGLENQCWKDSWDSISYHDGGLPGFPRATCELQGYAYDAKVRAARLARLVWRDEGLADELQREAARLKRRFNRDFWLADRSYFAVALDADGRPVDSLTSNIGHLLWSGIVDRSKARVVVDHLLGPRLFSGWGIRTLAEGEGRYNPIGYHVGTVWPFDNSFIAWGLRRYGYRAEAAAVAAGLLDAASQFDGRLPEAFGGYPREMTRYPVEYPTACSPQAWSTGAPLLLLRTMLGLEPVDDHLVVDPAVPLRLGHVQLLDIPGRWGRIDAFGRGQVDTDRLVLRARHRAGAGGRAPAGRSSPRSGDDASPVVEHGTGAREGPRPATRRRR